MKVVRTQSITDNRVKLVAFKAFAIAMPFIAILIFEGCLRLFGYGRNLDLFVDDKNCKDCWVVNKNVSLRYFNDSTNATIGNFEPFKKVKPKGTIRIFVLGESTTIGFPYMHNGSFHRWLQYRLLQMYPDVNFEIINLSLTAVNSFTVRDMAKELVNYQPDAVCIYAGHNEYYGALGAASTSNFGNNRNLTNLLIRVRQFRLFQLLQNAYNSLSRQTSKADTRKTLMERMVKDPEIDFGGSVYQAGITNFSKNIKEVCDLLSDHRIPVLLSTVVSNEKDLKPFKSNKSAKANKLFEQGQSALNQGRFNEAKLYLVAAKDQDMLRFRAPGAINKEIVRIVATNPKITLVDSYKLFEQHSAYTIIGNNLLLEHVHPNLDGYALLSDAFFSALKKMAILPMPTQTNITLNELKARMPITAADSAFGKYTIDLLRKQWPFNQRVIIGKPSSFEQLQGYQMATMRLKWNDVMDNLMMHYDQRKDLPNMLKVAEAVMLEYPYDPTFYVIAGRLSTKAQNYVQASNYLHRAFNLQPGNEIAQELFTLELKQRHIGKAIQTVDFGISHTPENKRLVAVRNILTLMQEIENKINSGLIPQKNPAMASYYKMFGELENSKLYE